MRANSSMLFNELKGDEALKMKLRITTTSTMMVMDDDDDNDDDAILIRSVAADVTAIHFVIIIVAEVFSKGCNCSNLREDADAGADNDAEDDNDDADGDAGDDKHSDEIVDFIDNDNNGLKLEIIVFFVYLRSCPDLPAECDWDEFENPGPNYQILYGALVGGPDQNDQYQDLRSDYVKNEVTNDYNAGFQGAVAGKRRSQPMNQLISRLNNHSTDQSID